MTESGREGRSAEALAASVAAVVRGGRSVVVEGAIGSGLTTFLAEVVGECEGDLACVLTSGAGAGDLGVACEAFGVTELADAVAAALATAPDDPLWCPRLVGAIGEWVAGHATHGRPVLLACDDVHATDKRSLALLTTLARRPVAGLVLLAAGRAGLASDSVASVCRAEDRVTLPSWDAEDIRRRDPGIGELRARLITDAAGGRPAFAMALARLRLPDLYAVDRLHVAELAALVDDGQARRWCDAADRGRQWRMILAAAAVAGRRPDNERIRVALDGVDDRVVAETLRVAVQDGILIERDARLEFAHGLLRGACYRLVESDTRARMHDALAADAAGTAIEVGGEFDEHIAHRGRADSAMAERLLHASRLRLPIDPRSAGRWANALVEQRNLPADLRAQARLVFADALTRQGQAQAAARVADELLAHTVWRDEATVLAARCERILGRPRVAYALLAAQATARPTTATVLELAAIAAEDPEFAVPITLPRSQPGIAATATVIDAIRGHLYGPASPGRPRDEELTRASDCVDALDTASWTALVEHVPLLSLALVRSGFVAQGHRQVARALHLVTQRGDVLARLRIVESLAAVEHGALGVAAGAADHAVELGQAIELPHVRDAARACRTFVACLADEQTPEWQTTAYQANDAFSRTTGLLLAESMVLCDELNRARDVLHVLVRSARSASDVARTQGLLAVVVARLGFRAEATDALALARAAAAGLVEQAVVHEAAAVLSLLAGNADIAVADARSAVRIRGTLGAPISESRARMVLADALRAAGDLEGASGEVGLAKSTLSAVGAIRLVRSAIALQKRIAAGQSRGLRVGEFGLSAREAEIAQLVCAGLTNREISTKLFLSVRTVDTHVARILMKVGVGSRVALTQMFVGIGEREAVAV